MSKVHASLFSGFGGADLAAHWMGWENAFWCEIDGFCRQVLRYWFPKSIGYENIKETDFTPWRGKVDVLTGGFPCQPFSVAGKRKGVADDRYLWPEMLRAIREIRPTWVIGENVAGILSMVQPVGEITVESQASLFEAADKETLLEEEYLVETICRDLEEEGYSVQPVVIPACAVGAPHKRYRVWFVAHANGHDAGGSGYDKARRQTGSCQESEGKRQQVRSNTKRTGEKRDAPYPSGKRLERYIHCGGQKSEGRENVFRSYIAGLYPQDNWRGFPTQPPVCRGNDGLPFDVVCLTLSLGEWRGRSIKGYGNAIVPQVIYEIFKAIETIQVQKNNK